MAVTPAPPAMAPSSASPRRNGSRPSAAPLLTWPEDRRAREIEARRTELRRRIARLKPRSYARIVAEAELRALTHRALAAETSADAAS